ncbi:hypothetical protein CANARDRAFT_196758 [[Candida] arabinofermentans NRRL YB-2248]|uniref:Exocyst complex component Sec8 n=1 Tax=[Candida] arabinofermentans NRRL YB-2248 TaxID=983967 RepID=A0A1E4T3B2_9ASCO|nr:hypothetical protein CANARDRAFT_196758 [[Candida] arabinofermentans NRRL YB-2248]
MEESLDDLESCLNYIKQHWPDLLKENCNPLEIAIPLLDNSSVGLAHRQNEFVQLKERFSRILKQSVNVHFDSFNDSLGSYGITSETIAESQSTLLNVRGELTKSAAFISSSNEVIRELNNEQNEQGEISEILDQISEIKKTSSSIDNCIAEKNFKGAEELINKSLKSADQFGLWQIPALHSTQQYLQSQSQTLFDSIIEEINSIVYLKFQSTKSLYEEQTKSKLLSMATTDIDDVSAEVNKPLEQFLEELNKSTLDDGVSPGKDIQNFLALKSHLEILNNLKMMDESLIILCLEKQISSVIYAYAVDEKLLDNVEQQQLNNSIDNTPFARIPKDYVDENHHEPIFQLSKLSFNDDSSFNIQSVLENMFPGQSSSFSVDANATLYIENENINRRDTLVAPNIFNMIIIIDQFLLFVAFHGDGEFHTFFNSIFELLNTSLYYRKPYANIILKVLDSMVDQYQSIFDEYIPGEFFKQINYKLVPNWLHNPELNQVSTAILKDPNSIDLIKQELELLLAHGSNKTMKLISEQDLLDNNKFNSLSQLLNNILATLDWLPKCKRVSKMINSDTTSVNSLKETWQITNSAGRMNQNQIFEENNSLTLSGDSIEKFDKTVEQLENIATRLKLILRYDLKCKSIWYLVTTLEKDIWMPEFESEEIDHGIILFNGFTIYANELLSRILPSNIEKMSIFSGLPDLIDRLLVDESRRIIKVNSFGITKIFLNIRVIQQMLRNVMENPESVNFKRSITYFDLFKATDKGVVDMIKRFESEPDKKNMFTIDEYKNMVRMVFSESVSKGQLKRQHSSYSASRRYDDSIKKLEEEFKSRS